jgi:hypothetical protein
MKNKKIAGALAAILLIGILAVAAYVVRPPSGTPGSQTQDLPKNPPIMGTLVSSTDISVTIALGDQSQKTFTLAEKVQIITQVTSREVGKTLAQIAPGTQVLIQPHEPGSNVADQVSALSAPTIADNDPAGPLVTITGTLVSTTTSSLTINTPSDPKMKVAITKNTIFISNVLAGQKGKTLNDAVPGTYVQVVGIATTKGLEVKSVQPLVPFQ